jgi:hypothetical protein
MSLHEHAATRFSTGASRRIAPPGPICLVSRFAGRNPSCFATPESQLLARCRFNTQAEARNEVFAFNEGFYNLRPAAFIDRPFITGRIRTTASSTSGRSRPAAACRRARAGQGRFVPPDAVGCGDP